MPPKRKRGYSYAFTPHQERRIKLEIDRVPATLDARLRAKLARRGLSLRFVTLSLWKKWTAETDAAFPELEPPL